MVRVMQQFDASYLSAELVRDSLSQDLLGDKLCDN